MHSKLKNWTSKRYRFDLFAGKEFIESFIIYCSEQDFSNLETEMKNTFKIN